MLCVVFFFKQKTAYEMRISDWSSDVCSSDLKDRSRAGCAPTTARSCTPVGAHPVGDGMAVMLLFCTLHSYSRQHTFGRQPAIGEKQLRTAFQQIGRASCRERVCKYV